MVKGVMVKQGWVSERGLTQASIDNASSGRRCCVGLQGPFLHAVFHVISCDIAISCDALVVSWYGHGPGPSPRVCSALCKGWCGACCCTHPQRR